MALIIIPKKRNYFGLSGNFFRIAKWKQFAKPPLEKDKDMSPKVKLNGLSRFVAEIKSIFKVCGDSQRPQKALQLVGLESLEPREVLTISGFAGQVAVINAPTTVEVNKLEDNKYAKIYGEQQNVTLNAPVTVDAFRVGKYSDPLSLRPATILAGTKVNSYYLHADRVGAPTTAIRFAGSVSFNEPVIGIVSTNAYMNESDSLGSKGTIYPKNGRVIDSPDWFTISDDRKTVTFDFRASVASDDIRIITATTPMTNADVNNLFFKVPDATTYGTTLAVKPPATIEVNKFENASYAVVFAEKTGLTLANSLQVDATAPGEYNLKSALTPATIMAGTKINSYYLHTDRDGTPTTFKKVVGSVTFDYPILGVIGSKDNMISSDILGATGTVYPKVGRFLESLAPANMDKFWISEDRKTLRYELQTNTASDDLRIITGVPTIPSIPLSLAAVSTNGNVNLNWKAPSFNGYSAIANYLVQYSADGGKTWVTGSKTSGASLGTTITGLQKGISYSFRVAASNAQGSSLYSNTTSVKTA